MKHKLRSRALTALLSLMLIIGLLTTTVFMVDAAVVIPTTVQVNGVDILKAPNHTVQCGNGTATYDLSSNTLTLDHADITTANSNNSGIYADGDLIIVLEADNTIASFWAGIQVENGGSVSLSGNGSLTVENAWAYGITADMNVSISADVNKLYVSSEVQALRSAKNGTITIGNELLIGIDRKITIENGRVVSPLYELMVNGVDILTAPNYTVACGGGKAIYDPSSNTLTLDKVQINYQQYADDNTKGAILFDGDLNIELIGQNTITSVTGGIFSRNRGTLTITGDRLTIDSVYYGIGKNVVGGNIIVDGAELDIDVKSNLPFMGMGFHAGGVLSIENGAYVNITSQTENTMSLMGNDGVMISDSTVYAHVLSENGSTAVVSDNDVSISNSIVDVRNNSVQGAVSIGAGNDLMSTPGDITISENSKVTIYSATGNAAYTSTGNIVISDSQVKATTSGDYPALIACYDVIISNGIVNASTEGQEYSIWAKHDLRIEGASDVTASGGKGAIGASGVFTVIPPDGKLIDVWMGNSDADVSRYSGSPLSEETVITEKSLYFHSELHAHAFDKQVVCDDYKANDATCTEPAEYYKSCICGKAGTETFTSGEALGHDTEIKNPEGATCTEEGYTGDKVCKVCGDVVEQGKAILKLAHSYKDGKCTVCGAVDPNYKPTEPGDADSDTPETGDNRNMILWMTLLFVSGTGLFGATAYNRKRKYNR